MTKIITFDGHDCVGKTSLIESGFEALGREGYRASRLKTVDESYDKLRSDDNEKNVWLYLDAWRNAEGRIADLLDSSDVILVDRSYYSTYVLAKVLNISVPDSVYGLFLVPDLSIQVTLDEQERLKRMGGKFNGASHDHSSLNQDIIRRANEIYATLGLIQLNNRGTLRSTTEDLCGLVSSLQ